MDSASNNSSGYSHSNTDIACQTCGDEIDKTQAPQTNQEYVQSQKVVKDIESLKSTIIKLESTVHSLETIIKDHDAILSLYNNATDLNARYLKEIQDKKQYIINLEQKLIRVEEVRDSLQLYSSYEINSSRKISPKSSEQGESQLPCKAIPLTVIAVGATTLNNTLRSGKRYKRAKILCRVLITITNNKQCQTFILRIGVTYSISW